MSWLIFALISVTLTVAYGLISKKILSHTDNYNPIAYACALFTISTLYSVLVYVFSSPKSADFHAFFDARFVLLLTIDILLYTTAPSFYYRALKHLPISEVTIISAMIGVFALLFGVFLGTEPFFFLRAIGACLIFFAVIVISYQKKGIAFNKYFYFMIAASIFYALAAIVDNTIISHSYLPLPLFTILNFGIPTVFLLLTHRQSREQMLKIAQTKKMVASISVNSFFLLTSFFAIFKAYQAGGSTSQVNLVISTETILTVMLAIFILKERQNIPRKILCGLIATVGIYLISTVVS